jgi:hypothetical protein
MIMLIRSHLINIRTVLLSYVDAAGCGIIIIYYFQYLSSH